jgi:hypothetical protein
MIIHTAADLHYWNTFSKIYLDNNRKFLPDAAISLTLVDRELDLDCSQVDILYHDAKNYDDIRLKYQCQSAGDVYSYYGLSRFFWLPTHDNVMVRDIDTLVVKPIELSYVDNLLEQHDVVNLVRQISQGQTGGLGAMFISKRVCDKINNFAKNLCATTPLYWPIDEEIKKFTQQNLSYLELEHYSNFDSTIDSNIWVVHAQSFYQINQLSRNLKFRSIERIKRSLPDPIP